MNSLIDILDEFLEATIETAREKKLRSTAAKMQRGVAKAFREQGKVVMQELPKMKPYFSEAMGEPEINSALTKAFSETMETMKGPVDEGIKNSLIEGGKESMASMKAGISFEVNNPQAVDYINRHGAAMVSSINETTRSTIKKTVLDGIKNQKSYDEIADEISGRFSDFAVGRPQHHIRSRAHHVAITECGNAFEEGNNVAARQLKDMGATMEKSWHTVGDGEVSEGCATNEGQGWIDMDQSHASGHQHPLRFPGCRCHERYRRKKEPEPSEETKPFSDENIAYTQAQEINAAKSQMRDKYEALIDHTQAPWSGTDLETVTARYNMIGEAIGNQILSKMDDLRKGMKELTAKDRRVFVFADDSPFPVGSKTGVMGNYNAYYRQLRMGSSQSKLVRDHLEVGVGKHNVGIDYKSVMRHEYGHHIQYNGLSMKEWEQWKGFYEKKRTGYVTSPRTGKQETFTTDYWRNNVSQYADTNHKEAFAESFAAYTSPLYKTKVGKKTMKLPDEVEQMMESLIGKRNDL